MSLATSASTWASGSGHVRHQTISIIVENRTGVLARISALFARRGFNIISLAVAPSDDEAFSRITIVVDLEEISVEQLTKQLFKLVNVVKITEMTPGEAIERELVLLSCGVPRPAARAVAGRGRGPGTHLRGDRSGRGPRGATVMLAGQPADAGRFRGAAKALRDHRYPTNRPGGVAKAGAAPGPPSHQPPLEGRARRRSPGCHIRSLLMERWFVLRQPTSRLTERHIKWPIFTMRMTPTRPSSRPGKSRSSATVPRAMPMPSICGTPGSMSGSGLRAGSGSRAKAEAAGLRVTDSATGCFRGGRR